MTVQYLSHVVRFTFTAVILLAVSLVARAASDQGTWCLGEASVAGPGPSCTATLTLEGADVPRAFIHLTGAELNFGVIPAGFDAIDDSSLVNVAMSGVRSSSRSLESVTLSVAPANTSSPKWSYELSSSDLRRLRGVRLPPGSYMVTVHAENHTKHEFVQEVGRKGGKFPLILLDAYPRLSGRVVDARSGQGMSGTAILDSDDSVLGQVSSAAGDFELYLPADSWPRSVGFGFPGRGTKWVSVPARLADTDLGLVSLAIAGSLRVNLPKGVSVRSIRVQEVGEDEKTRVTRRVRDVSEGQETLVLDDVAPGDYELLVSGDGALASFAQPVTVRPAEEATVDLSVDPIDVTIRATYQDQPIGAGSMYVEHGVAGWKADIRLDDQGTYKGQLWQPGPLAGYLTIPGRSSPFFATRMFIGAREETWELNAWGQTIRGRVVTAKGGRVASPRIAMQSEYADGGGSKVLQADELGEFVIEYVRPGRHRFVATAEGFLDSVLNIQTLPNETVREIELVCSPGATRSVLVLNANGTRAVGADVLAPGAVTRTGADGRASVTLPAGETVRLFVIPREGSFGSVLVSPGDDQSGEISIPVPAPEVSILVRAESDSGAPIAGVGLLVRFNGLMLPLELLQSMHRIQGLRFESNADGKAQLNGLPVGLYEFWPVFDYSQVDRINRSPGASAASLAAQPGANWVIMTFEKRAREGG